MYCINQYDIRMKKEPSPECGMTWPHELHDVTKYLTVRIQTEWRLFIFLDVVILIMLCSEHL